MASVFISYRREDSAPYAGRLCDRLAALFGHDRVFMDVEDIRPGQDFTKAIEEKIASTDAVIAVIGPEWLVTMRQRVDAQEDFVRSEIAEALKRDVTVIPVLVGGAVMPGTRDLPGSLAGLSKRQAVEVRDDRFDEDIAQLTESLKSLPGFGVTGNSSAFLWNPRILKILIPVTIVAAAIALFVATRPRSIDVTGAWIAEMQNAQQQRYRIRLDFAAAQGQLIGSVRYPTGDGTIRNGRISNRKLYFETSHVPQFASEPVTIRFQGEVEKDTMHLTAASDNGTATGIAHRAPR